MKPLLATKLYTFRPNFLMISNTSHLYPFPNLNRENPLCSRALDLFVVLMIFLEFGATYILAAPVEWSFYHGYNTGTRTATLKRGVDVHPASVQLLNPVFFFFSGDRGSGSTCVIFPVSSNTTRQPPPTEVCPPMPLLLKDVKLIVSLV